MFENENYFAGFLRELFSLTSRPPHGGVDRNKQDPEVVQAIQASAEAKRMRRADVLSRQSFVEFSPQNRHGPLFRRAITRRAQKELYDPVKFEGTAAAARKRHQEKRNLKRKPKE